MFNHIDIGDLAQAYGLDYQKCFELALQLDATIEMQDNKLAEVIPNIIDDVARKMSIDASYNSEGVEYYKNRVQLFIKIASKIVDFGDAYTLSKNSSIDSNFVLFRYFLLSILRVDKISSVKYLKCHGYTIINNVPGLSKEFCENISSVLNIDDISINAKDQAVKWREISYKYGKRKKNACLYTACKWEGKTHIQAYKEVKPKGRAQKENMTTLVNKEKPIAQEVIDENFDLGLMMPPWDTKGISTSVR